MDLEVVQVHTPTLFFRQLEQLPTFHIAGVTPGAETEKDQALHLATDVTAVITPATMVASWRRLYKAAETVVDVISLGHPHFSYEFRETAVLVRGRTKHPSTEIMITCGRDVYQKALDVGAIDEFNAFGVKIITDTCLCVVGEPIIQRHARSVTNSGKHAHYGEGLTGSRMRLGSLSACVEAACTGFTDKRLPAWLL